jgi:hypothetical protein
MLFATVLSAQEMPFCIYGPAGYPFIPDFMISQEYATRGLRLNPEGKCYYIYNSIFHGEFFTNSSYSLGLIDTDGTNTLRFMGHYSSGIPLFGTGVACTVIDDQGFRWQYFDMPGYSGYSQPFNPNTDIEYYHVQTDRIDDEHAVVLFIGPVSPRYLCKLDRDANEIWGFPIDISHETADRPCFAVIALDEDSYAFGLSRQTHLELRVMSSSGELEHLEIIPSETYYGSFHKTKIPGTILVTYREAGVNKLGKFSNNAFSYITELGAYADNAYHYQVDADENYIYVMGNSASPNGARLSKLDWEGNLVWSNFFPGCKNWSVQDQLEISDTGSVFIALAEISRRSYLIAKVLADGSQNVTSIDNPSAPAFTGEMSVFPNPFRESTTIRFEKKSHGFLQINIYNLKGQKLRTFSGTDLPKKEREIVWDGKDNGGQNCATGLYMIQLQDSEGSRVHKALKLK